MVSKKKSLSRLRAESGSEGHALAPSQTACAFYRSLSSLSSSTLEQLSLLVTGHPPLTLHNYFNANHHQINISMSLFN